MNDKAMTRAIDPPEWKKMVENPSRAIFLALSMAVLFNLFAAARGEAAKPAWASLIEQAGNTEDERERYRALKALDAHPELTAQRRAELQGLLFAADWWANGREKWLKGERWPGAESDARRAAENGYLCGWFNRRFRNEKDFPGRVAQDSPLYPLWCFYRARILIAIPIQSGNVAGGFANYYDEARLLLEVARRAYPKNRLIGMYLGIPIPWPAMKTDPKAPAWANLQREGLEKLAEIIHWWIAERQLPDGQFGGGWGDDCEMWRWWRPVLIGFEDPTVIAAQEFISERQMGLPYMQGGYTTIMSDVEHTGEDTADSITPMLFLKPDSPVWRARALRLGELMRTLWTGRNARGQLMFRSTYFTAEQVDERAARACDTVYHPRAVQPALLCWLRTGDPGLGTLFSAWMDTWVDASARQERGKPAGIIPTAIHWPDGGIGGTGENWWQPGNYPTTLYDWPSNMTDMTDTLLLAWHMTGNEKYLEPLRSMARHRRDFLAQRSKGSPAAGSAAWCAERMGFLASTLSKYRLLSVNAEFDDLLRKDASGYIRYRLDRDLPALERDLTATVAALRRNRPAFTTEVRWTDRVLAFQRYEDTLGRVPHLNPTLLLESVTGSAGDAGIFPLNAVRWLTPPREIAVLVTDSATDRFTAEIYHFGDKPRRMAAECYLLQPGNYRVELLADGAPIRPAATVQVTGSRTRIEFELPARRLCTLRLLGKAGK